MKVLPMYFLSFVQVVEIIKLSMPVYVHTITEATISILIRMAFIFIGM
jgi:hypothetical protein